MIVGEFRREVVRPTLERLGAWSLPAEELLIGTALHESRGLRHIRQKLKGGRPGRAVSFFQIEPATAADVAVRYLGLRPDLRDRLGAAVWILSTPEIEWHAIDHGALEVKLLCDMAFAVAIARLKYWMIPAPLPEADDLVGLAAYWKAHYNTAAGKGSTAAWLKDYRRYTDRKDC